MSLDVSLIQCLSHKYVDTNKKQLTYSIFHIYISPTAHSVLSNACLFCPFAVCVLLWFQSFHYTYVNGAINTKTKFRAEESERQRRGWTFHVHTYSCGTQ